MIKTKTSSQIKGIKKSCQLAKTTLAFAHGLIKPGVSTGFINQQVHQFILDHHALPAPLGYRGFPKSICTSINDVVCHGIPSFKTKLKPGDIINVDITAILNGFYGDTSATFPVSNILPSTQLLLDRVQTALSLAIAAVKPGISLNQAVGLPIQDYVSRFGYSVVRQLGGHGTGLHFHEDPFVYHFDTPANSAILKPGMIFTIEPMINASPNWRVSIDKDGWTVCTTDKALSAQFEHTILVTPTGCDILTK